MKIFANKEIKKLFLAVSVIWVASLLLTQGFLWLCYQRFSLFLLLVFVLSGGAILAVGCSYFKKQNQVMEQAVSQINAYLDGAYVPKSRFNEVNEEKKTLTATVTERDKQLEALKKSTGDAEKLKAEIKSLQDANKKAKEEADSAMKNLRISDAIKMAIASDAQDVDIVSGLVDKEKLILGEDGKITGLKEQVEALKKNKPFLFKAAGPKPGYHPNAGEGGGNTNPFAKETFNLTEQGKLFRENPEQARAMAAAAGGKI